MHTELVDGTIIPSKDNPRMVLCRINEVFNLWFELGYMPYTKNNYPSKNKEWLDKGFYVDFIYEGLDQIRVWFYTLMLLNVALFDKTDSNNIIVNGLVLARDRKNMSKPLKNYPDPNLVINQYGAN